jgi:hypothetical protein
MTGKSSIKIHFLGLHQKADSFTAKNNGFKVKVRQTTEQVQ